MACVVNVGVVRGGYSAKLSRVIAKEPRVAWNPFNFM